MLQRFAILLIAFFASLTAAADPASLNLWRASRKSAHRDLNESWTIYQNPLFRPYEEEPGANGVGPSALESAVEFGTAKLGAAPAWHSMRVLTLGFKAARDPRVLADASHPDFPRRITWLYPDDGCFARATLAVRNLIHSKLAAPGKLFVFGDLAVNSPNIAGGIVGWWYNVAPVVEVNGQKWILDPAIEPHGPLKLEDWLARMSPNPGSLKVSLCKSNTYTPDDSCRSAINSKDNQAVSDENEYMSDEWARLIELQRDPVKELGDSPPWLVPAGIL